ncbi:hypothetical protein [Paenibacillus sp. PAMC21692]|nr:hypothetical protein [Paenibacillus sp. PAMC21692]
MSNSGYPVSKQTKEKILKVAKDLNSEPDRQAAEGK